MVIVTRFEWEVKAVNVVLRGRHQTTYIFKTY